MGAVEELNLPKEIPEAELSMRVKEWLVMGVPVYSARHTVVLFNKLESTIRSYYCHWVYRWKPSKVWTGEAGRQNDDGKPRMICDETNCPYGRSIAGHCRYLDGLRTGTG